MGHVMSPSAGDPDWGRAPSPAVLLTGFEPFGGETANPAAETANALHGRLLHPGFLVQSAILPVTWDGAFKTLVRAAGAIAASRPLGAVIMLGQAAGYPAIGLERVAVNTANGKDSSGSERENTPIVALPDGGPPAYFSTLPLDIIQRKIEAAGLPAFISDSAGTYLCNYVFYAFMHYLATVWPEAGAARRPSPALVAGKQPPPPAGFVHVPYLPEQAVGKKPIPPSMSRSDIERAILTALAVTAETAAGPP
jgi:pyroglutamyl-peptidase